MLIAAYYNLREKIKNNFYLILFVSSLLCLILLIFGAANSNKFFLNNLFISPLSSLRPITNNKGNHEVFGFAPFWTFEKLDNIDFNVLTTLSYFGVPVDSNGNLVRSDYGYIVFQSKEATKLFTKAHNNGTRVVLTLTQMDNFSILSFLDNSLAQENAINQAVSEVSDRGIDGINVDFEYSGDPGEEYRSKFTQFVKNLTQKMHERIPSSRVTVSVYAGSVKEPKIYDIKSLASVSDGIFMMAYDFGMQGSDNAIPTAPLYGYRERKYWYDVSTAVDDFLKLMPPQKLILGVPWYSYNYAVYEPQIKSTTLPYYWAQSLVQTYSSIIDSIKPNKPGISNYKSGWDNIGQNAWKSYFDEYAGVWRIVLYDDVKSLGIKSDFIKNKNLGGIGIWALGFDDGKKEFWRILEEKFGIKLADSNVMQKVIYEISDNI